MCGQIWRGCITLAVENEKTGAIRLEIAPVFVRWRWRELNPRPKQSPRDVYRHSRTFKFHWEDSVQQDSRTQLTDLS